MRSKSERWIGRLLLVAIFAAGFISSIDPSMAGIMDDIRARGKLIAGVKGDYKPFGYFDASGKQVGFDVDLARRLAKTLLGDENKVELVPVTSAARIPYLQSKKIDVVIASMSVTEERKKLVEFSDPYFLSGLLMLVPKTSSISGPMDLNGKVDGEIKGSTTVEGMKEVAPWSEHVIFDHVNEAVFALKSGQIDAFTFDDILILTLAHDNPDLKTVGDPFKPGPIAIAVGKGEIEFVKWINDQLASMRRDGTYDHLWEKHLGNVQAKLMRFEPFPSPEVKDIGQTGR
jgi:ABC-type amino acid transport substrate-binding protein